MNNKLILDLTVRLTQALDQNYDVVNMDTVLAVLSALEGATITKEQLETTRLAKHINQLRRRNKNNIIAIRAKNLLKTWREMVGITSQAQSEVGTSISQQVQSTQQQVPKPPLLSSSQPTSPYTSQLLGENLDNSLSSIGGGVEFSRTATGGVINTGSVNFAWSKGKSSLPVGEGGGGGAGIISSRSNGALTDTQMRLMKGSNRCTKNSNSPSLPGTTNKVKHPTSFKNLLTGFNANNASHKQTNPSALSPQLKIPISSIEREEPSLKTNSTTFVIDDDDNHSQPSTTTVVQTGISSPRTHKSTKRKERDSPIPMVFIDQSNSPIQFENMSEENEKISQVTRNANNNQVITSTIDLPDSNSSSNFVNALCEATNPVTGNGRALGSASNSNTRIRKDKKHPNERIEKVMESENFQPNIDESSRIAFPISGIQEYLSLSNSSMSIFPSQQTAGSGGMERYQPKAGSNENNQHQNSSNERNTEVVEGDLTFAGKFKQNNNSCGIEVGSAGNYFSNGKENSTLATDEFPCTNSKNVENNCRDSLSAGGTASTSTFLPFNRNSNDSTSSSRNSQLDLIDVVNQDSQSMITVDDLRQQQPSSNQKNKTQKDVESTTQDTQQMKYTKETSNKSKQLSKEQSKPPVVQKPINTSSKPSTPTSASNTLSLNTTEQKVPKKRGRKKGSKGVDSVLAQMSGLSSQFLVSPALGSSKKVKTTMELLADIQNRKLGSATSSPTLMNWLGTSRPASSCSEPSLHSPRTSDACSTNATVSTVARSTPEKNVSNHSVPADEIYESDSDSNTSEPSHDSAKGSTGIKDDVSKTTEGELPIIRGTTGQTSTIDAQIKDLMSQLPPVNVESIDWEAYEDVPCTCTLREILPEPVVKCETADDEDGFELFKNVERKEDDNRQDGDEPIISVNVHPPAQPHQQQQQQASTAKPWPMGTTGAASAPAHHSISAPVSTVTSPVVPSTNQRPMKSIFDLDFDDDNDPLHSFVEAVTKTENTKDTPAVNENGRIKHNPEVKRQTNTPNSDHSNVIKSETQPSESTQQPSSIESASYQFPPAPLDTNEPILPQPFNFPTYEVIEDPNCQAKLRYHIQTNQITQFHINAFHNCFIPNVNGNWDHSVPQNIDDDHMENDSLYANVVPKYGCFVKERIPKDLSHVKFTKNYKPKHTDKSDKPPPPFLGVANIHRRQHFRLHHHRNHHRKHQKKAAGKRTGHASKVASVKPGVDKKIDIVIKEEQVKDESQSEKEIEESVISVSYIPEQSKSVFSVTEESAVTQIKENAFKTENTLSPTYVPEISQMNTHDTNYNKYSDKSYQQQSTMYNHKDSSVADTDFFPVVSDMEQNKREDSEEQDESHSDHKSDIVDMKRPILNGNFHHLMNNNSIVQGPVDASRDEVIASSKRSVQNNKCSQLIDGKEDEMAASRRSSSCSNSSLKQNQNSINMKLRRHRLAQRQSEMQKRHRKRKNVDLLHDVLELDMEDDDQPKDPPLIKRIKIVNGGFPASRRMTNSITDSSCVEEDGDSDCHVHSENDIITEEEIDDDPDVPKELDEEDDYEDIADDYDEEDGDDEEDPEEDYGDFREVVTRDMTSSTTGNNHIVLTIKKTPSKTNSPSSSSMSPAPIVNINVKQPSISPTIQSLLLEETAIEHLGNTTEQENENKDKLDVTSKLIKLNAIKTEDLNGKTEFLFPKATNATVYNFELKKNGEVEHEDSENEDNNVNDEPQPNEAPEEMPEEVTAAHTPEAVERPIENDTDKKDNVSEVLEKTEKNSKLITKAKLSESLLTTRRELRRLELKRHLREGIEEAQKLHRQLFYPYELHTSIGSKILEINSCTSGCTDPSDGETDTSDSEVSDTTSDEDALFRVQKRRRTILPSRRRKAAAGGGGGDPSSSSSSSSDSSDSDSTSSSYSAFTSWTTSSEDENKKPQVVDKKEQEQPNSSSNIEDTESERELPVDNNYLLRSFNHIYVSTEERRRQQQLKEAAEYRRREIMNAGYITITGGDSKENTSAVMPPLTLSDNCDVYTNYYNNPTYNIYSNSNNSNSIASRNTLPTTTQNSAANANTEIATAVETSSLAAGTTAGSSNYDLLAMAPTKVSSPTHTRPSSQILDFLIEQTSQEDKDETLKNPTKSKNHKTERKSLTSNDSKSNLSSSDNSNDGQSQSQNNKESDLQTAEPIETLIPQEEYRTGLRQVDEDVDDEDGNNCARTQQFKEWHEVLQLRSYNDELLTVLPYVVIE